MERELDVLIFGGGAAGLWLLDELRRAGYAAALAENRALGHGQTISSQGIIHGGLKYTLGGALTGSARAIRRMPEVWRDCQRGLREPDLSAMGVLSEWCYLWRTGRWRSRFGLLGAKAGLRAAPETVPRAQRPEPLCGCPGKVYRVGEQVIEPAGFLRAMAQRNAGYLLRVDAQRAPRFETDGAGRVRAVRLTHPETERTLTVRPATVALTAGGGNAALRRAIGLDEQRMQRRPLHQVMVRGPLPALYGHCIEGAKTRLTVTAARDRAGWTVWQLGGELAERGARMDREALIGLAQQEVGAVLPGVDFEGCRWSAYRVDRAESATPDRTRPDDAQLHVEGNVMTGWPTKLALAPRLAERVIESLPGPKHGAAAGALARELDWPEPPVAEPPWETETRWTGAPSAEADRS